MNEPAGKSEVALFRERQALEEQAARLALNGYAEVARHERITARMELGGQRILRLIDEGKHEEAMALMNTNHWGVAEEQEREVPEEQAALLLPLPAQAEKRGKLI
jgi:hypothetical protein